MRRAILAALLFASPLATQEAEPAWVWDVPTEDPGALDPQRSETEVLDVIENPAPPPLPLPKWLQPTPKDCAHPPAGTLPLGCLTR